MSLQVNLDAYHRAYSGSNRYRFAGSLEVAAKRQKKLEDGKKSQGMNTGQSHDIHDKMAPEGSMNDSRPPQSKTPAISQDAWLKR